MLCWSFTVVTAKTRFLRTLSDVIICNYLLVAVIASSQSMNKSSKHSSTETRSFCDAVLVFSAYSRFLGLLHSSDLPSTSTTCYDYLLLMSMVTVAHRIEEAVPCGLCLRKGTHNHLGRETIYVGCKMRAGYTLIARNGGGPCCPCESQLSVLAFVQIVWQVMPQLSS